MSTNGSDIERIQTKVVKSLQAHWKFFLAEGIILLVLGVAAIAVPLVATVAIAIIIGWVLLLSGIIGLISTFRMRHAPGFWWSLVSAILAVVAGVVLLRWPLTGALSLTCLL